jgi:hypothetical protein
MAPARTRARKSSAMVLRHKESLQSTNSLATRDSALTCELENMYHDEEEGVYDAIEGKEKNVRKNGLTLAKLIKFIEVVLKIP